MVLVHAGLFLNPAEDTGLKRETVIGQPIQCVCGCGERDTQRQRNGSMLSFALIKSLRVCSSGARFTTATWQNAIDICQLRYEGNARLTSDTVPVVCPELLICFRGSRRVIGGRKLK